MEYNSNRELLIIPEYGRNVQNLINYCKTVEDPQLRQALAERIVVLMSQMNPQTRTMEDYQVRLWKHFFQIANYDIDVTPPFGEKPRPEDRVKKPEMVNYPTKDAKFRHYGSNVQKLIAKAVSMEDGPKKDAFVEVIASYMKLAYKTWNREHYVSDDMIIDDLENLSGGKLKVAHNADLDNLHKQLQQQQQQQNRRNNDKRNSGSKQNRRSGSRKRRKR